jgi:hypothetical protein
MIFFNILFQISVLLVIAVTIKGFSVVSEQ